VVLAVLSVLSAVHAIHRAVFATQHAQQPSLMKTVQYVLVINFQFVANMTKTSKQM
jgi:hypothetical protein